MTVTQEELDEFFHPRNVISPTHFSDPHFSDVIVDLAPPGYSETVGVRVSH